MLKTTTFPLNIKKNINNNNNSENIEIKNNCRQYSAKQQLFNPDKFSPPNQWNIRLLNRVSRSTPNARHIVI